MFFLKVDLNSAESKKIIKIISEINGWLLNNEAVMLFEVAKSCKGIIVEIGSWKGKSTVCLALGSKEGNNAKVYAVDPHINTPCHKNYSKGEGTFSEFIRNLQKSGVSESVFPIVKKSKEASADFNHKIDFLFIDGDHSYNSVKEDFELWFPKLITGGIIAFHDAVYSEVKRLIDEKSAMQCFSEVKLVDRTAFAEKLKDV